MAYYDYFLSHDSRDKETLALPLKRAFQQAFLDKTNIVLGDNLQETIDTAIPRSHVFLLIVSANSINNLGREESWVRKEICRAVETSRDIVVLTLGGPNEDPKGLVQTFAALLPEFPKIDLVQKLFKAVTPDTDLFEIVKSLSLRFGLELSDSYVLEQLLVKASSDWLSVMQPYLQCFTKTMESEPRCRQERALRGLNALYKDTDVDQLCKDLGVDIPVKSLAGVAWAYVFSSLTGTSYLAILEQMFEKMSQYNVLDQADDFLREVFPNWVSWDVAIKVLEAIKSPGDNRVNPVFVHEARLSVLEHICMRAVFCSSLVSLVKIEAAAEPNFQELRHKIDAGSRPKFSRFRSSPSPLVKLVLFDGGSVDADTLHQLMSDGHTAIVVCDSKDGRLAASFDSQPVIIDPEILNGLQEYLE